MTLPILQKTKYLPSNQKKFCNTTIQGIRNSTNKLDIKFYEKTRILKYVKKNIMILII